MARRAWGEGSYDYNEKLNRWRWRGYYQNANGENKRKEIVSKSRKELKDKVKKFLQELENNHVDAISTITIGKWCQIWLNEIVKPSVKIKTYENYKRTCNNHIIPVFGKVYLKKLQPINIQKYLNKLCENREPNTVITIRNHFIILLNAAIEYGYVKINVAKRTKPPKKRSKEINPLNDEQIKKLLYIAEKGEYIFYGIKQRWQENDGMIYLRKSYYVVVVLALTTGMRQGEIFGLKWENISFSKKSLYVVNNMVTSAENGEMLDSPKTVTSKRNILLPQRTLEVLQQWQIYQKKYEEKWSGIYNNSNNLVFTNSYGNMVSITNFTKRYFRKMLRAANINDDVTFHTLRHTHATQLLKHGVNIKVVSERLGHSSTSVTMNIYAHALPDMQESAINELNKIY